MRQGELLGLEWSAVDLDRKVVHLYDTKNDHSRRDRSKGRDVPLSPTAIKILKALPRYLSGRVFPIGQMAVVHAFERACARTGIENLRFHDLRHEATSGPAKATAAVALARICNMLDKGAPRDGKQPHEMTGQELETELTRLRHEAAGRTVKPSRSRAGAARAQNDGGTVFD